MLKTVDMVLAALPHTAFFLYRAPTLFLELWIVHTCTRLGGAVCHVTMLLRIVDFPFKNLGF